MICTPKKNTLLNLSVVIFLVLLLAFVFYFSYIDILPQIIWQFTFFLSALLLIELLVKFFLPEYSYILDKDVFKITKTMGKKITTVAAIDLDKIDCLLTSDEYKKQDTSKIKSVFNYNANIFSASCSVLVFSYNNSSEAIYFEPSSDFAFFLKEALRSASFW